MYDVTVLIVERDERRRTALVTALRHLGLRALGVILVDEAVNLLDGIDAEVVLVRAEDGTPAVEELKQKSPLVIVTDEDCTIEEAVVELLRALGRPEEAAGLN